MYLPCRFLFFFQNIPRKMKETPSKFVFVTKKSSKKSACGGHLGKKQWILCDLGRAQGRNTRYSGDSGEEALDIPRFWGWILSGGGGTIREETSKPPMAAEKNHHWLE